MSPELLLPVGSLAVALVAAWVLARLIGPWVWLGLVGAVVAGLVLRVQGNAATGHMAGLGEFLMTVLIVAPAALGWLIGSIIGLRKRGRG